MNGKNLSNQLSRYLEFLGDYQLNIKYVKGQDQVMADFLSRIRPCDKENSRPCRQCRNYNVGSKCEEELEGEVMVPPLTDNNCRDCNCRVMTRSSYNSACSATTIDDPTELENTESPTDVDDGTSADTHRKRRRKNDNILHMTAPNAQRQLFESQWSRDHIINAQLNDSILSVVHEWLLARKRPEFSELKPIPELRDYYFQIDVLVLIDGIMYRKYFDNRGQINHFQVLIPSVMQLSVLELAHGTVLCHAKSLIKNEKCLTMYAYWPGWRKSMRIFIAACRRCLEYQRGKLTPQGFLHPTGSTVGSPGELLSIDLTGPHPPSEGCRYILTAQDCFSKYLFLLPLRDKTAEHVATALMDVYINHGFYAAIKCDMGSEFVNSVQAELDVLTGITRYTTTAYTPRQNPVERPHRELHGMIAKLVTNHASWKRILPYISFAYNSTIHSAHNFTPNFLHYGRELQTPLNLLLPQPPPEVESYGEFVSEIHNRISVAYDLARQALNASAELARKTYNKHVRPKTFAVGDQVLVFSPRKFNNKFPKWQRQFANECTVTAKLSDISYIVYDLKAKRNRVVHVDKLKLLPCSNSSQTK